MSRFMIRKLRTLDEFKRCEQLQREAWGFQDIDIVPVPMFVIAAAYGGITLGGFETGSGRSRMVGFVYSLPAKLDGAPVQFSHMLAVEPDVRRQGLGLRLKLAQGHAAVKIGYDTIIWTYDPLQARNARLNLRRLGAITRDYLVNLYGETSSPLHRGLQTDRLLVRWRPNEARRRRRGEIERLLPGEPPVIAEAAALRSRKLPRFRIAIPAAIDELKKRSVEDAMNWQFVTRDLFTKAFRAGFEAVDFELEPGQEVGYYVLARRPASR